MMHNYLSTKDIKNIFEKIFEFESSSQLKEFLTLQESKHVSQSKQLWNGLEDLLNKSYESIEEDELDIVYTMEELRDDKDVKSFLRFFIHERKEMAFQKSKSLERFSEIKHIDDLLKAIKDREMKIKRSTDISKIFSESDILGFHNKIEEIRGKFTLINSDDILGLNSEQLISFLKIYFSIKKDSNDNNRRLIYTVPNKNYSIFQCSAKLELTQVFYNYSTFSVKDYYSFQWKIHAN